MIALGTVFGLFAMSLQISCPPTAVATSERKEITVLARELVPAHLIDNDFERVEVSKCASSIVTADGKESTTETVSFDGRFSNTSDESDVTIQDKITCRMTVTHIAGRKRANSRNCVITVHTELAFGGISKPISVPEDVSVDDVRQFLRYLSRQVGTMIDGRIFTQSEFSDISSIMGSGVRERKHLSAVFEEGCSSSWIEVIATGDQVLEFDKLERRGAIC